MSNVQTIYCTALLCNHRIIRAPWTARFCIPYTIDVVSGLRRPFWRVTYNSIVDCKLKNNIQNSKHFKTFCQSATENWLFEAKQKSKQVRVTSQWPRCACFLASYGFNFWNLSRTMPACGCWWVALSNWPHKGHCWLNVYVIWLKACSKMVKTSILEFQM